MESTFTDQVADFFRLLQRTICAELELLDKKGKFVSDKWDRPGGGGGLTKVMQNGAIFEKVGVNHSVVFGDLPAAAAMTANVSPGKFIATGISLVVHPLSPMIPTVHANYRHFVLEDGTEWFGGGSDLTPYYFFVSDTIHFHKILKEACDRHDRTFYPAFKRQCDEYFLLRHRGEARGVGGIFFDHLKGDPEETFAFVRSAGNSFLASYVPIVEKRRSEPWNDGEREWQLLRRGRYVEFNLLCDRGTAFGLETKGRTESILMSLPPLVRWSYDFTPEPGSREAELIETVKHPRDWI